MLGSGDLRASLGLPSRNPPGEGEHLKFRAAVAKLVAAAKGHGLPLMAPAFKNALQTADWLKDFKLLITGADTLGLVKAHQQDLAEVKEAMMGYRNGISNGH